MKYRIEKSDPLGTQIKMQRTRIKLAEQTRITATSESKVNWMVVYFFVLFIVGAAVSASLAFGNKQEGGQCQNSRQNNSDLLKST